MRASQQKRGTSPLAMQVEMESSTQRSSTRQLARFSAGDRWFPYGISEVVAHGDGRFVSIAVSCARDGRNMVLMNQFSCVEGDACLREMRTWLRFAAGVDSAVDSRATEWADLLARRIVAALSE